MRGVEGKEERGKVDDKCARLYTALVVHNTHATYTFDFDFLARFKVVKLAYEFGSNDDAFVRPVALLENLRDLPIHSVANAGVALLRACQINSHNNNPLQLTTSTFVTLLLPFSPSAIARNPTTDKSLLRPCITRRHASPQHPVTLTSALHT